MSPRAVVRSLAALALSSALWMAADQAWAAPNIEFDHRTFHFGRVVQGKVIDHQFTVTNTGDTDLIIEEVFTPCGCTGAVAGDPTIPPGGTTTIDVTYDSSVRSGEVTRVITVTSNDPDEPELTLQLIATVDASMHEAFQAGEALFGEKCGSCHADPAEGLSGQELFTAVCWYCHGKYREGKTAPALPAYPDASRPYLRHFISEGKDGTEMPGYARGHGGPLDAAQITSLVDLLQTAPPDVPEDENQPEEAPAPPPVGDPNAPFFQ